MPRGTRAPPLAMEYAELPKSITIMPLPPARRAAAARRCGDGRIFPSPALRLGLEGPERRTCGEYASPKPSIFESRGEPKRGRSRGAGHHEPRFLLRY